MKSLGTAARTSVAWAAAGGELLLLAWSIPVAILLVGLPIVLVVRLVVEIAERLFRL
jgi:hypothetical protein